MTDSSRPKAATTTSQRPARLADKHDEAAVAPARPVAALLAVLTGCPLARSGLLPERFGMQLPGVLRSLPSRLRKVKTAQALQRLGAFSCSSSARRCAASSRAFARAARTLACVTLSGSSNVPLLPRRSWLPSLRQPLRHEQGEGA